MTRNRRQGYRRDLLTTYPSEAFRSGFPSRFVSGRNVTRRGAPCRTVPDYSVPDYIVPIRNVPDGILPDPVSIIPETLTDRVRLPFFYWVMSGDGLTLLWMAREVSAPHTLPPKGSLGDMISKEGDYSWLEHDWSGADCPPGLSDSPGEGTVLNRLARLLLIRGDIAAASLAAFKGLRHLLSGLTRNPEEALFCEETIALIDCACSNWESGDAVLADVAHRSGQLLGPCSPQCLRSIAFRAAIASRSGHSALALEQLGLLLARDMTTYGPGHRFTVNDRISYARELGRAGRFKDALCMARVSTASAMAGLGELHPLSGAATAVKGEILAASGDFAKAASALSIASEICRTSFGPDHPRTLDCALSLASALVMLGRAAEAEVVILKAASALSPYPEGRSPETASALKRLLDLGEEIGVVWPDET
ncbi:MAG: tetratricopeptide repeat protein [Deltaproteobacteria bacterium]|nr:tetratricopeptide repeat protein [Deltaproteobacteria bacterium]